MTLIIASPEMQARIDDMRRWRQRIRDREALGGPPSKSPGASTGCAADTSADSAGAGSQSRAAEE